MRAKGHLAVLEPLYPILCLNSSHVKDISIMFPWQKQYLNCSLRSLIKYCLWHKIYIFIIFISSHNSYIHIFPPPSNILYLPNKREWNNWLLKTPPPPPPQKKKKIERTNLTYLNKNTKIMHTLLNYPNFYTNGLIAHIYLDG